jgi:glycosyltransferase involved in cell wall biosynthesis
MEPPRVTAVIPTWNLSRALRCAIASALDQSFADFELLVMGDGCTDDSAEVAASFRDPRVVWHNLPANSGTQLVPNNAALERARGEYVAYLGHDDLWLPHHLENLVRTAEQTGADFIAGGVIMLGPPGSGSRVCHGDSDPRPHGARRHL